MTYTRTIILESHCVQNLSCYASDTLKETITNIFSTSHSTTPSNTYTNNHSCYILFSPPPTPQPPPTHTQTYTHAIFYFLHLPLHNPIQHIHKQPLMLSGELSTFNLNWLYGQCLVLFSLSSTPILFLKLCPITLFHIIVSLMTTSCTNLATLLNFLKLFIQLSLVSLM